MTEAAAVEDEAGTFEDFFHAHHERLLRVLYLATGDRHEAEDLGQDAFARVFERWSRVRQAENPAGYLYRVPLNPRRSRLRRVAVAGGSLGLAYAAFLPTGRRVRPAPPCPARR